LLRTFFKIALVDADLHKSGLNLGMEKQEREPHTIQPQIRLREKLAHLFEQGKGIERNANR
jgi:hypothetical protein